jgi:hypothetical protein
MTRPRLIILMPVVDVGHVLMLMLGAWMFVFV